jgi:hypothetical protein
VRARASGRVVRSCRGAQIDSRYLPTGGFGGLGGNGSGGGVGVGDGVGLGGAGLGGDGVSCMIQSRFMSSEVETSLTLFLTWRDKQSEIPRLSSLAATHRGFALITRTARCLRQLP